MTMMTRRRVSPSPPLLTRQDFGAKEQKKQQQQ
jgi:hypothetical protein